MPQQSICLELLTQKMKFNYKQKEKKAKYRSLSQEDLTKIRISLFKQITLYSKMSHSSTHPEKNLYLKI